jgi:hypothetical protein
MKQKIILLALLQIYFFSGCSYIIPEGSNTSSNLSIEEHTLKGEPTLEPLTFIPEKGTQDKILSIHERERENTYSDNSFHRNNQFGMITKMGNYDLEAVEVFTDRENDRGDLQAVNIHIVRQGEVIFTISAGDGSPIQALRGLWSFSNHWVLEIAYVTEEISVNNEITDNTIGKVIQDGKIINEKGPYKEVFGFQLLKEKAFYFFIRNKKVWISYDNHEFELQYDQVPHYLCCSGSVLNPKVSRNMVSFFGRKGSQWFYVEMGVFDEE